MSYSLRTESGIKNIFNDAIKYDPTTIAELTTLINTVTPGGGQVNTVLPDTTSTGLTLKSTQSTASDIKIKGLLAGTNVTLSGSGSGDIVISAAGGGGSSAYTPLSLIYLDNSYTGTVSDGGIFTPFKTLPNAFTYISTLSAGSYKLMISSTGLSYGPGGTGVSWSIGEIQLSMEGVAGKVELDSDFSFFVFSAPASTRIEVSNIIFNGANSFDVSSLIDYSVLFRDCVFTQGNGVTCNSVQYGKIMFDNCRIHLLNISGPGRCYFNNCDITNDIVISASGALKSNNCRFDFAARIVLAQASSVFLQDVEHLNTSATNFLFSFDNSANRAYIDDASFAVLPSGPALAGGTGLGTSFLISGLVKESLTAGTNITMTQNFSTGKTTISASGGSSSYTPASAVYLDNSFTGTSNGSIFNPWKTIPDAIAYIYTLPMGEYTLFIASTGTVYGTGGVPQSWKLSGHQISAVGTAGNVILNYNFSFDGSFLGASRVDFNNITFIGSSSLSLSNITNSFSIIFNNCYIGGLQVLPLTSNTGNLIFNNVDFGNNCSFVGSGPSSSSFATLTGCNIHYPLTIDNSLVTLNDCKLSLDGNIQLQNAASVFINDLQYILSTALYFVESMDSSANRVYVDDRTAHIQQISGIGYGGIGLGSTFQIHCSVRNGLTAGSGVTLSVNPSTGNTQIAASFVPSGIQTVLDDTTATGQTLISSQSTSADIKLKELVAGTNITLTPSGTGNLTITATGSGGATDLTGLTDAYHSGNNITLGFKPTTPANYTGANTFVRNNQIASVTTAATGNCGLGAFSLNALSTGDDNCAYGNGSLLISTTGNFNTGYGTGSLFNLTTGSNNTAIGNQANVDVGNAQNRISIGSSVTNTIDNSIFTQTNLANQIGASQKVMLYSNTTGQIGGLADSSTAGQVLTTNAAGSLFWDTPSSGGAVEINGLNDGRKDTTNKILNLGFKGTTTGVNQIWITPNSQPVSMTNAATGNIVISGAVDSMQNLTTGTSNVVISSGASLRSMTIGTNNTAINTGSLRNTLGNNNTGLGTDAGRFLATGDFNTFLGAGCSPASLFPNSTGSIIVGGQSFLGNTNNNEQTVIGYGITGCGITRSLTLSPLLATQAGTANRVMTFSTLTGQVAPIPDGAASQVLQTNGSGGLSWATVGGGGGNFYSSGTGLGVIITSASSNFPNILNNIVNINGGKWTVAGDGFTINTTGTYEFGYSGMAWFNSTVGTGELTTRWLIGGPVIPVTEQRNNFTTSGGLNSFPIENIHAQQVTAGQTVRMSILNSGTGQQANIQVNDRMWIRFIA